jgi:hypothetical protein
VGNWTSYANSIATEAGIALIFSTFNSFAFAVYGYAWAIRSSFLEDKNISTQQRWAVLGGCLGVLVPTLLLALLYYLGGWDFLAGGKYRPTDYGSSFGILYAMGFIFVFPIGMPVGTLIGGVLGHFFEAYKRNKA